MTLVITGAIGWIVTALVMVLLWLRQKRTKNAGIVDVTWATGVGALAIAFAAVADGEPIRRSLVGLCAGVWSLRLALHLLRRMTGRPEDGRYADLRTRWGTRTEVYFFAFFQIQALWVVLFAVPMAVAARNPSALGWTDLAAVLVWLVSIAGESIADLQLGRFVSREENAGKVCRAGLWRYSRHPNYFFEWLHWWAYVLFAIGSNGVWFTAAGALVMLYFLLRVTGIPPTEARALSSRGEAYREYQQTTSAFVPWPPKERGFASGNETDH